MILNVLYILGLIAVCTAVAYSAFAVRESKFFLDRLSVLDNNTDPLILYGGQRLKLLARRYFVLLSSALGFTLFFIGLIDVPANLVVRLLGREQLWQVAELRIWIVLLALALGFGFIWWLQALAYRLIPEFGGRVTSRYERLGYDQAARTSEILWHDCSNWHRFGLGSSHRDLFDEKCRAAGIEAVYSGRVGPDVVEYALPRGGARVQNELVPVEVKEAELAFKSAWNTFLQARREAVCPFACSADWRAAALANPDTAPLVHSLDEATVADAYLEGFGRSFEAIDLMMIEFADRHWEMTEHQFILHKRMKTHGACLRDHRDALQLQMQGYREAWRQIGERDARANWDRSAAFGVNEWYRKGLFGISGARGTPSVTTLSEAI